MKSYLFQLVPIMYSLLFQLVPIMYSLPFQLVPIMYSLLGHTVKAPVYTMTGSHVNVHQEEWQNIVFLVLGNLPSNFQPFDWCAQADLHFKKRRKKRGGGGAGGK